MSDDLDAPRRLRAEVQLGTRGVFCRCCGTEIIYTSEGKLKGMGDFDCNRCDAQIQRAQVCLSFWELLQLRILPTPRPPGGSPVAMGLPVVMPFGAFDPEVEITPNRPWWKRLRPGWKLLVEEWDAHTETAGEAQRLQKTDSRKDDLGRPR